MYLTKHLFDEHYSTENTTFNQKWKDTGEYVQIDVTMTSVRMHTCHINFMYPSDLLSKAHSVMKL